jgi:hypothetical protein
MIYMINSSGLNTAWQSGGSRKLLPYALLDFREVCQAWHTASAGSVAQIDVRVPYPPQRPRHGARHTRKFSDSIEFSKLSFLQRCLNCRFKNFRRHRIQETASQAAGNLRKIKYLKSVFACPRSSESPHFKSERSFNDYSSSRHHPPPHCSGINPPELQWFSH